MQRTSSRSSGVEHVYSARHGDLAITAICATRGVRLTFDATALPDRFLGFALQRTRLDETLWLHSRTMDRSSERPENAICVVEATNRLGMIR